MKRLLGFVVFALLLNSKCVGAATAGGACPSGVPSGVTSCFFIDAVNGLDSNPGNSEASPWQHAPSMADATSTAAAHTPGAGEGWIFKGGVTWGSASWPMNVPWGGASGSPDYMGVDQTWYTGSSWARPIFNGGGSSGFNADNYSFLMDVSDHASYVVIDNIEFTGLYWDGAGCNPNLPYGCNYISQYGFTTSDVSWEIKNVYMHGWSHNSGSFYDPANNQLMVWLGDQFTGSSFHDSVINGSDTTQDCCGGVAGGVDVYNDDFEYLYNVIFGNYKTIHDNRITNMIVTGGNNGAHGNCIHLFVGPSQTAATTTIVYNNWINCLDTAPNDEMFLQELNNSTLYVFNNVMTQDGHGTGFQVGTGGGVVSNNFYYWNNTLECGPDPAPSSGCTLLGSPANVTAADNLWITNNNNQPTIRGSGGTNTFPSPLLSVTCSGGAMTNIGGNQICAPIGSGNGAGNLNLAETYPFAPLDATAAAKISTGQNNAAYCAAVAGVNAAAGTACLSDTTMGVAYNSTTNTVSFPARATLPRPTGSAPWHNGAYEFGTVAAGAPNPPTDLTATVD